MSECATDLEGTNRIGIIICVYRGPILGAERAGGTPSTRGPSAQHLRRRSALARNRESAAHSTSTYNPLVMPRNPARIKTLHALSRRARRRPRRPPHLRVPLNVLRPEPQHVWGLGVAACECRGRVVDFWEIR